MINLITAAKLVSSISWILLATRWGSKEVSTCARVRFNRLLFHIRRLSDDAITNRWLSWRHSSWRHSSSIAKRKISSGFRVRRCSFFCISQLISHFSCLRKEISRRGIARFLRVNAIICMAVKATRHALIGYRPVSADTVHEKSLVSFIVAFTISAFEICRSCEKDYLSIAWIIYQSSMHNFGKLWPWWYLSNDMVGLFPYIFRQSSRECESQMIFSIYLILFIFIL